MTTDASHDYAALAEANLTPVLGRYFQRDRGATASGIGCSTPTAAPTSTSPTGSRSPRSATPIPEVTAADPRPGRQAHRADLGDRLRGADLAPRDRARGDVPGPARLGDVPEFGLGGHRRRAQARPPGDRPAGHHRLPRRLPRPDIRGGQRHDLEHQLPDRLRAVPAGRLLRSISGRLSRIRRTRPRRRRRASRSCARS